MLIREDFLIFLVNCKIIEEDENRIFNKRANILNVPFYYDETSPEWLPVVESAPQKYVLLRHSNSSVVRGVTIGKYVV